MWKGWKVLFITDTEAQDEIDTLKQKKRNLRTEWTKSTPNCPPQNLYYIVLNYRIGLSSTITKQQNRRYNCKKYKCHGEKIELLKT